ncbi:unnamed protein product, partial [Porites evermanni]
METWYQSLISSPPFQALPSCACASSASKCLTCDTWKTKLKHHHTSGRPKICWDNSDRTQWGSPTGAWEIAKVFMPTLGGREKDVSDAETTDIGGLLNLLEWCPFINPPASRTVLKSARDECRNHWAHAPKQELEDSDVLTIFDHLESLLNDPVFFTDKAAQEALGDLNELQKHGLVNVTESEIAVLRLLRLTLQEDLVQCRDRLSTLEEEIALVKKQEGQNTENINKLLQEVDELKGLVQAVDYFNKQKNEREDIREAFEAIYDQDIKPKFRAIEVELANFRAKLQEVENRVDILEEKFEKGCSSQKENDYQKKYVCTAPRQVKSFFGRESALKWLEDNLVEERVENNRGTPCSTKAICGLGGCGKTSVAIEFAWKYWKRFPGGVFWINGESDEAIKTTVTEILAYANDFSSRNEDLDYYLNKFLARLSKKELPWLLIVDNADELRDSSCPSGIKKIFKGSWQTAAPTASEYGHILLTTRQNAKDTRMFSKLSRGDCFELPCFSEEEGARFLMRRTNLQGDSDRSEAISLAKELGGLPLALEQAAAYICASHMEFSFKDYLDHYQEVKVDFLKKNRVTSPGAVEAEHRLSVHSTWNLNFKCVKEKSAAAALLMQIVSFVDVKEIPFCFINPGLPEIVQEDLGQCASSKAGVDSLLKDLSSYSLVSVDDKNKSFSVHPLVKEVIKDSLTESERSVALDLALQLLDFAISDLSGKNELKPMKMQSDTGQFQQHHPLLLLLQMQLMEVQIEARQALSMARELENDTRELK